MWLFVIILSDTNDEVVEKALFWLVGLCEEVYLIFRSKHPINNLNYVFVT